MENLQTIFGIAVVFVALPLLICWLNDRIFHRRWSKRKGAGPTISHNERLMNPNFAAVEAALGSALPEAIKKLYADKEEIMRENFDVLIKLPGESQDEWTVAFYLPADAEQVRDDLVEGKTSFCFANDGCGDDYLIEPGSTNPEVQFHDHETGEFTKLGVDVAGFLAAPRKK